jgi:hypothetical protein
LSRQGGFEADGETVAFKATSAGAIGEIGELVGMYGSADRQGLVPAVEIESRNFESRHGTTVWYPVFQPIGWKLWDGEPLPPVQPIGPSHGVGRPMAHASGLAIRPQAAEFAKCSWIEVRALAWPQSRGGSTGCVFCAWSRARSTNVVVVAVAVAVD